MNLATNQGRPAPGPDERVAIDVNAGSLARLEALQARYGNVVAFNTPRGGRGVFVNDPAVVRQRRCVRKRHDTARISRVPATIPG